MFSGIVEATTQIQQVTPEKAGLIRIRVGKPGFFDDLKIGDSIAVNGVCLTVECFDEAQIQFALGTETIKVLNLEKDLGESSNLSRGQALNLERSLRWGDRVHGHLVSGHVDALGKIVERIESDGSLILQIEIPENLLGFVWQKGSLAINGVSLTVNAVVGNLVSVCLIPETQKRTNLGQLKVGDSVTLEADYFAKGLRHFLSHNNSNEWRGSL
jgi:riboflavin synthase